MDKRYNHINGEERGVILAEWNVSAVGALGRSLLHLKLEPKGLRGGLQSRSEKLLCAESGICKVLASGPV
jgi:hypothetical protein